MLSFAVVALVASLLPHGSVSQNIDPNSVPSSTKASWCLNQRTSCPLLCLQVSPSASTTSNDCDPKTLDWSCVCANGITPNVSEYSLTIPYYECTEYATQCVSNCGLGNNACASNCRDAHPCGAQSPTRINATTSTTTAGSEATSNAAATSLDSFGGAGSNGAATTSSAAGSSSTKVSAAITALNIGQAYGLTVVFGGIFAGFALML